FADYRLRIGQVVADTHVPAGQVLLDQRLDVTETGAGAAVTLLDAERSPYWLKGASAEAVAKSLGLEAGASGLVAWDVFNALTSPGDVIAVATWRDQAAAEEFESSANLPEDVR